MEKLIMPYIGNDKYAFVSYCHHDEEKVYPIISDIMSQGCRLWYDAAINPGLEWPEIIAEQLSGCNACIAFVSEASLMSHNCRKEINFALMKNKPLLIVMLDEVQLSPGMEMQLSTVQSILAYRKDVDVVSALDKFDALSDCFSHAAADVIVPFPEMLDETNDFPIKVQKTDRDMRVPHTEVITRKHSKDKPPIPASLNLLYIVRVSSEQCIVPNSKLTVGRSLECGYPLSSISEVSMRHAEFFSDGQSLYVTDCGSTNGTFVNGERLSINQKKKLALGDEICFGGEKFVVRCGIFEKHERIRIEEIRKCCSHSFPSNKPIVIGSEKDKCTMFLSENSAISRNHLRVETDGASIFVTDLNSTNGSYMQGKKLVAGKKELLNSTVTIADEPLYISFEPDRTEG